MIAVPESVAFYWGDPVNRAAVNVLVGGVDVPADLSLLEAERFELAQLAARRVQVEHWSLLRALWLATWGEAVRAHLPAARLLGYGDQQGFAASVPEPYADPSVRFAWNDPGSSGVFSLPGNRHLFTALWILETEQELQLQFYLLEADGMCTVSSSLDLGSQWGDDGSDRRETAPGLLPFLVDQQGIDVTAAAALVGDAVAALAVALKDRSTASEPSNLRR